MIRARPPVLSLLFLLVWLAAPFAAQAAVCNASAADSPTATYAQKVAAIACRENILWYSPFIDVQGRLASITASEGETMALSDGYTPAWKRVADYWRDSGLMGQMAGFPGATDCSYANASYAPPACRAFLIDKPWSAAFVSYVMAQARLPGFRPSPSHFDYVRAAYAQPAESAYRFADPDAEPATIGDLLCFVRANSTPLGFLGMQRYLAANSGGGLFMHCDIVVGVDRGAGKLYTVGGNVLQGVTLRILAIDRNGMPKDLPRGAGRSTTCWPENEAGCNFNRQDWVAVLKLRPASDIAALPLLALPPSLPSSPSNQPQVQCCVNCVVGSGVPRCPRP
ncbi:DUF2272 domain-containing protein [Luteimonas aquatica]|uniref:DUF2272 domain-containing protein n=1 Tax=Luteimonas aquatica TaxID=450364 RepID=UPI001F5875F7|nr:DUF2272 domain-containing protein [Luteimonas aquatica]